MNQYEILRGDCISQMRAMPDNSFDSIVCDPPYELGFMGKSWDASGIAYSVEMWREALRVLKPGGHLLAFSGSRTYHRMTCAIEDAGFEVRDQIMWIYGSGFPKSMNVANAIHDAAIGQPQGGKKPSSANHGRFKGGCSDDNETGRGFGAGPGQFMAEAGAKSERVLVDAARQWEGWGTALKPAHEPICVARKPLAKGVTVAANVLQFGTGALNIDGCRVATNDDLNGGAYSAERKPSDSEWATSGSLHESTGQEFVQPAGRWPANLIHDGSDEVVGLFPDAKGQQGAVTGNEPSSKTNNVYGQFDRRPATTLRIESETSAARFFYCAKASKSDRGPNNTHPTVKPLALMQYLCRLVTPPGGRILDPFAGSGSTIVAALREGFIAAGIELIDEHADIIEGRVDHELYGDLL